MSANHHHHTPAVPASKSEWAHSLCAVLSLAPRATVILVRTCSEIPLPSPLFYSLSCQRAVAIWTSALPLRWSRGSSPVHASSPWQSLLWMTLDVTVRSEVSKHRSVGEFGWGGTPFTTQRRRPEALLRQNRNLPGRRRPKVLLMPRLSVRVRNVQVWPNDPLVKCADSGYRSQRCQKNYHRDNWLVAAKRSKRRRFLILRCRLFLASHPQPSGRVGLFTHQQGT